MSQSKDPTTEKFTNSTCKYFGHDWITTTHWRGCKRERCRASERLVNGEWVSNAAFYRQHQPVVPTRKPPRQITIWETNPRYPDERS